MNIFILAVLIVLGAFAVLYMWPRCVLEMLRRYPQRARFHYVDHLLSPDIIQVWLSGWLIYSYAWISGVDSPTWTSLGAIHAIYATHAEGAK